jgi:hypothetical protein
MLNLEYCLTSLLSSTNTVELLLQELSTYLAVNTTTSVIVDRSSDGDFLRIDFNMRWIQ